MLQFHDFNGGQMLRRLWLRARLIAGNEQESGVHDSRTVQHRCHQNVVTRAIDKANVTHQLKTARTVCPIAWETVIFTRTARCVAHWPWAFRVVTFENFGIGITCLNGRRNKYD